MDVVKFRDLLSLNEKTDLHLSYAGLATVGDAWKTENLAAPFNRLYFIESGSGLLKSAEETIRLEPGNAYLLPAGLPFGYECLTPLKLLYFHFNLTLPDRFDLMSGLKSAGVVNVGQDQIEHLIACCESSGNAAVLEVRHAILGLVLMLDREYGFGWAHRKDYSPTVTEAVRIIRSHLSAELSVETLARQCFVSQNYLTRLFRREIGMPVKQFILSELIGEAQQRLSHTHASVEQISADLGFCNQFYFSACFKRHCRVSPLQYRNGTRY